jgi:5-(carboxyamino)imidazole ribonucleotide mutase
VTRRTWQEWAALTVAFVFAGAIVAFAVVVVGSFVNLPAPAIAALAVLALATLAYPIFRAPAPAAPVEETPAMERTVMSDAPLVGIVMGSQSDMAVMEECSRSLESMGIPYEVLVASAHRQPAKVHEWAAGLADRGVKVVIAAAGKAAHLGGVVAAYTPLPVIAVPMKTSDLGGLDSLLSMVQMPSGVPVACVAINGARNAAILAAQILGTSMPEYRAAVERLKSEMAGS